MVDYADYETMNKTSSFLGVRDIVYYGPNMPFGDLPGSVAFNESPGVFDEECLFLSGWLRYLWIRVHILIHRNDKLKLGVL